MWKHDRARCVIIANVIISRPSCVFNPWASGAKRRSGRKPRAKVTNQQNISHVPLYLNNVYDFAVL